MRFGDEEGISEDYETDQELKKPQLPLAKAPMTGQITDLPKDFSVLDIDDDSLEIINRRKSQSFMLLLKKKDYMHEDRR